MTISELQEQLILPAHELTYRIERKLVQKFPFINPGFYVEKTLRYHPELDLNAVLYDGYWQSFRYLEHIAYSIVSEFKPKEGRSNHKDQASDEIASTNSVSIHIRRGDYLTRKNRRVFASCSPAYYRNAIQFIRKSVSDPSFFVFSNEIEWARNEMNVVRGSKIYFIDNSSSRNQSLDDFIMMSRCKHQIIANSSFSWWAAWLNENPEKIVISPRQWYNGRLNETTQDLIPETWIRL